MTLDGWLKQSIHMLKVKTSDLEWLLHHQLSKKRSSMIQGFNGIEVKQLANLDYVGGFRCARGECGTVRSVAHSPIMRLRFTSNLSSGMG